ncbi:MAG: flagellar hook-basal body protein [Phycisphaerae bacterium]
MIYGLYHSAAGMLVNEYRQDVLANNIANADTVGFKRDVPVFSDRLNAVQSGDHDATASTALGLLSGGIQLGRTQTDFREGGFAASDNPLDVAIEGPGFLVVRQQGKDVLTRDGRMLTDAEGVLRSAADGAEVLGEGGASIRLNPRGGDPAIDEQGRISQDGAVVARLALTDVADPLSMRKVGAGRWELPDGASTQPAAARVFSRFTESSGVESVKELASMITASRAYQLNAQMLSMQDQSLGRLINAVAAF